MSAPMFTVFTATYNRAHTLPRVFAGLRAQTYRGFEWLIVDDGSTDGTEALVAGWAGTTDFAIRYVRKANAGKHTAHNVGVREARGALFLNHDSDDTCEPFALEHLLRHWEAIPTDRRERFTGVTVLARTEDGALIGEPFAENVMDMPHVEMITRFRYKGDKWGFHRTEILRRFPQPEFPGERYAPEGIMWCKISHEYLMRFVNDPLLIVHYQAEGISLNVRATLARSPCSAATYYREFARHRLPLKWRLHAAANIVRFEKHAGIPLLRTFRTAPSPLLAAVAAPVGLAVWAGDRRAIARQARARADA